MMMLWCWWWCCDVVQIICILFGMRNWIHCDLRIANYVQCLGWQLELNDKTGIHLNRICYYIMRRHSIVVSSVNKHTHWIRYTEKKRLSDRDAFEMWLVVGLYSICIRDIEMSIEIRTHPTLSLSIIWVMRCFISFHTAIAKASNKWNGLIANDECGWLDAVSRALPFHLNSPLHSIFDLTKWMKYLWNSQPLPQQRFNNWIKFQLKQHNDIARNHTIWFF